MKKYVGSTECITIPEGITVIGCNAFAFCSDITEVTVPDTVTDIGESAFYDCENLRSIVIPDSVTNIGDRAFYNCRNLTAISVPDAVSSIGEYVFSACHSLTDITLSKRITQITHGMFFRSKGLISYAVPVSVTEIKEDAFCFCVNLKSIRLHSSVTSISPRAFIGTDIRDFILPGDVYEYSGSVYETVFNSLLYTKHGTAVLASFLRYAPDSIIRTAEVYKMIEDCRGGILRYAVSTDDIAVLQRLLSMLAVPCLDLLNEYIEYANGATACTAYLLNYKNTHYTAEEQDRAETFKIEEALDQEK